MNVAILGAGKVGRALFRALREAKVRVRLVPLRRQRGRRFDEDLLIVAVRDPELPRVARDLARRGRIAASTAVVHVAGGVDPEVLAPLRAHSAGIGQAHPMISFASERWSPALGGAHLLLRGDRVAVQRGRQLARALKMVARRWEPLDAALYHAAGGLVANGAAALCAAGARLLEQAGAPPADAPKVLGPLLASVAINVSRLGFPGSLTGPIRRGDAPAVRAHLERIGARAPELLPLYGELAELQLQLASQIGEAPAKRLNEVRRTVRASAARANHRPRRR